MTRRNTPLFAWPGASVYGRQLLLMGLFYAAFYALYGGTSRIADNYTAFHRVHVAWELRIPFMPGMVHVYLSLNILLSLAPFVFRSVRELCPLLGTLLAMTVVAVVCFLVYPVEVAFARPPQSEFWFRCADLANMNHNQLPSLHVAFATAAAMAYGRRCGAAGRLVFHAWALAISASTVLIHEHHLLDVVAGWALSISAMRWLYPHIQGTTPVTTGERESRDREGSRLTPPAAD